MVVASSLNYVKNEWAKQEALPLGERDRGQILRDELAGLGPIFVKIGQTLSQRPDIVGEEACKELSQLQTENEPFGEPCVCLVCTTKAHAGVPFSALFPLLLSFVGSFVHTKQQ